MPKLLKRIFIAIILTFLLAIFCKSCFAVDLLVIAEIESNNNPHAYNSSSGATGKYQITKICLQDYNNYHTVKYTLDDMYNAQKSLVVASWYLTNRIPQLLRYYGHTVNLTNTLVAYNWGISHVGEDLPKETRNYIMSYNERSR